MEDKIHQVKVNFNKIKDIRNNVAFCFNALENKLTKLKITTTEFVKNNRNNIFVFGLDSFQFQSKLIDYEYNDMKKFYLALNNRMYCEYYKLYKIVLEYAEDIMGTNKNIIMLKANNIFPIYKDLEPLKQYNFDTIEEIHKTIISLLNTLNEHILFKESQLQLFQQKQKSGLNINNFVNTFDFDVIVIKQKCLLFLSYLDFFHMIHTKHFKRFSKKMTLMNDYLDEDIKFDEELQREDDSLKSSESTSSLDTNNDAIEVPTPTNKLSMNSLLKSNVKKVMTNLNVIKPNIKPNIKSNNNIENYLSSIKNPDINEMLASLSQSFDSNSETIYDNKSDNIFDANVYADDLDKLVETDVTIYAHNLVENKDECVTTNADTHGLKMTSNSEINESINGHKLEDIIVTTDMVKSALDLKQMVDIFNTNEEKDEEKDDADDDTDKGEPDKEDVNEPNNTKKKKKKKKKKA
jgi:hypothetical protein